MVSPAKWRVRMAALRSTWRGVSPESGTSDERDPTYKRPTRRAEASAGVEQDLG